MATFLYIINEHMAYATQGSKYVVRKSHKWNVDGSWVFPHTLAYIADGVLKLEEGEEPVWVKNRWPHAPMPTEKEIMFMLLQAEQQ